MTKGKRERLTDEEIRGALDGPLDEWELVDGKLHRSFQFENFVDAFSFMTKLALVAERMDHHPEWTNVYGRVSMSLTTHDTGGISSMDVELARAADHHFDGS